MSSPVNSSLAADTQSPAATAPVAGGKIRLQYIDGLRGVAVLMVLLFHCWAFGNFWKFGFTLGHFQMDLGWLASFGHIGVNLFLVLSGFCLYWPYMSGGTKRVEPNLWQYFKRRSRRLLPPYYVALLLFAGVTLLQDMHGHTLHPRFFADCLLMHLAMLHNMRPGYALRINGVFWTQALEFQLYIFFPLLVEAYRRVNKGLVLLAVFLATSAYRIFVAHSNVIPQAEYLFVLAYSVFGRLFEFTFGMYIADKVALRHAKGGSIFQKSDYVVLGIIALGIALDAHYSQLAALGDALCGFVFGIMVFAASHPNAWLHRALSWRGIAWVGTISYSIYLVHAPFVKYLSLYALKSHPSNSALVLFQFLLVVPLVVGMSYVFHLLFEKPFLNTQPAQAPPRLHLASAADAAPAER